MKKNKNMSPLIIVGMLVTTALADVSHVLSGAAHPPANPVDVNSLAGPRNAFQSGNPNDFWWMSSNSPLKEAYDYYKKCSNKGDCLPPLSVVPGLKVAEVHYDPVDLKKNPFLNGEIQAGPPASSSSFSFSSSSSSSSGCTSCSGGSKTGEVPAFHSGTKIDISNNPFLTGKFATAGNGDKIKNENGFIGVQPKKPAFATSHPLSNKKPFPNSPPNGPQSFVLGGDVQATECKGKGYLCVAKDLCVNGVVNRTEDLQQIRDVAQYCNVVTEICCRLGSTSSFSVVLPNASGKTTFASNINDLASEISAGKSSVTGSSFKFSGGVGSSPGQIQVLIDQPDNIKPQVYHNGESGSQPSSSTNKATRDVTSSATAVFPSTVDYSDVQISNDIRFGSTIRGPAYLPPIGPTPPSTTPEIGLPSQPTIVTYQPPAPTNPPTKYVCPSGTFLTPSGTCETLSPPTPQCPFGTIRTPDGNCERPVITTPIACPPGSRLSYSGSCEIISTPPPPCPFGTIRTPDGICERPITPTTPRPCPIGTISLDDGSCASPSPRPCPPGTFLTSSGLCQPPRPPVTTPLPICPYGTLPDGSCFRSSPPPSPRPCPAGTFLTASGICQPPSPSPPSCPFGTFQRPDGSCISTGTPPTTPLPCPPGTILTGSGLCESIATPTPRPPCPPGTIPSPSGICRPAVTTVGPSCPLGTYLSPSGICETPSTHKPPPRPFATTDSRDYLPPVTPTQYVPTVTKKPYQPSITTEKPFQPSVTQKIPSNTPFKPFVPSVTPSKPFQPSATPQIPTTTQKPYYPQVTTPTQPPVTTLRPYQPSSPRPHPFLTTQTDVTSSIICTKGQVLSPSGYGCVYPSTTSQTRCLPGQKLSSSGICQYPSSTPGYEYPKPTTEVSSCGPGKTLSSTGSCLYTPYPSTQPRPGSSSSGKPFCAFGQVLSPSGDCIYPTTPSFPSSQPSRQPCGFGQVLSSSGSCIYPSQSTPRPGHVTSRPTCLPGQTLSSSGRGCEYPKTSRPTIPVTLGPQPSSKPSCGPGQIPSPSGYGCIYPSPSSSPRPVITTHGYEYPEPTTPSCQPGQVLSPTGSCIYSSVTPGQPTGPKQSCGPGQVPRPSGIGCEYPRTPKPTLPGLVTPGPQPSCGPGQVPSPSGFGCIYPSPSSTPRPATITHGYDYPRPTTPSCQPGQIVSPTGSCIYPSITPGQPTGPKQSCGPGQVPRASGIGCEYPITPKPTISGLVTPGPQPSPKPSCGPGQVPSPSGYGCIYPSPSSSPRPITTTYGYDYPKPTTPSCQPGQIVSPTGSCIYPSITPGQPTGPKQSCGPGQVPRPSGIGCEYPRTPKPTLPGLVTPGPQPSPNPSCGPGQVPSPSGYGCIYPSPSSSPRPITTPHGYDYPKPTTPSCQPGQIVSPTGSCIYPSITPGQSTGPKQSCGPGQVPRPSGIGCEYPRTPKPTISSFTTQPSCPFGTRLSPVTNECLRPTAFTGSPTLGPTTTPRTSCRSGQILSSSGICIYPQTSCRPGQIKSSTGLCVYPSDTTTSLQPTVTPSCGYGQIFSSGLCVYPSQTTPTQQCAPGQVLSPSGSCITGPRPTSRPSCAPGQVPSSSGFGCEYPPSPGVTSCPFGQKLSPSGSCELPRPTAGYNYTKPSTQIPTACPAGQILAPSGYGCVYPGSTTNTPACPRGQVPARSGAGCEYPKTIKPEPPMFCPFGTKLSPVTNECITSSTKSPGYEYPKPSTPFISGSTGTPRPIGPKECPLGQILSSSGSCIYQSASTPRPIPGFPTEITTTRPFTRQCGPGQILSDSGVCVYSGLPTPSTGCGRGQVLSPSGACIYPSASTPRPISGVTTGYTYPRPTTSFVPGYSTEITTTRQCGQGQILSDSGVCVYSGSPTPSAGCGRGQVLSPSGTCIYPTSSTLRPIPGVTTGYTYPRPTVPGFPTETTVRPFTRQCGQGQILSDSGVCVYSGSATPSTKCGRGQVLSASGTCIYPSSSTPRPIPGVTTGYTYPRPTVPGFPTETTVRPFTRQCGQGQILSDSGVCVYSGSSTPSTGCGRGQVLSPSGTCIYPSSSTPRPIPGVTTGYTYPRPTVPGFPTETTVRPFTRQCGPGQILSDSGVCVYSGSSTPSTKCGRGQVLSPSGTCIYPSSSTPRPITGVTTGYTYPRPTVPGFPTETTVRPFTRQCGPGQILSDSGVCVYSGSSTPSTKCGRGQVLSPSGTCIYPSASTPRPIPGYSTEITTTRPFITQCGPGQILSNTGACVYSGSSTIGKGCGRGQVLSPSGVCIYPSSSTPRPIPGYSTEITTTRSFTRQCGPGQILSDSGVCVYSGSSTITTGCGRGQVLSPSGTCVYPSSSTPIPIPGVTTGYTYPRPTVPGFPTETTVRPFTRQCGPGQILSDSGVCVYSGSPTPSTGCGRGQVLSSSGDCIYASVSTVRPIPGVTTGYTYPRPTTSFVPGYSTEITTTRPFTRQCRPGQILSDTGACVYSGSSTPGTGCGRGQVLSPSGVCIYPSSSTPRPIPGYSTEITTTRPFTRQCGAGQILSDSGICVYSGSTPSTGCGRGQVLSPSGVCIYQSASTPRPIPGVTTERPQQSTKQSITYPTPTVPTGYKYPRPSTPFEPDYPSPSNKKCPFGKVLSPSGTCVYPSSPTGQCGPGQILSPSGTCVYQTTRPQINCKQGQELSESGTCFYPAKPSSKPPCGPGQILSSSGSCVYSSSSTRYEYPKPSTPLGPNYSTQTTVQPSVSKCGPGQILSSSGTCVYSSLQPGTSPKPPCGPEQILSSSGLCVYSQQSTTQPIPTAPTERHEYSTPSIPYRPGFPTQTTVRPTAIPRCGPNQILSASGVCVYSSSSTLTPTSKPSCAPGQELSESGICVYLPRPTSKPSCGPGQTLSPSGSCSYPLGPTPQPGFTVTPSSRQCGAGQVLSPSGSCVYSSRPTVGPSSCAPGQELSSSGICFYPSTSQYTRKPKPPCGPGQLLSSSGSCISSTPSFPTKRPGQCPPGAKPSAFGSGCEYPRPTPTRPTGESVTGYTYPRPDKPFEPKPQCPPGQRLGASGFCVPSSIPTPTPGYDITTGSFTDKQQPCPPGSVLGPSGSCQFSPTRPSPPVTPQYGTTCPFGTVKTASGLCESTATPVNKQCPFGTRLSPSGSCETGSSRPPVSPTYGQPCPPGTVKTSSGLCERPSSPTPPQRSTPCPPGSSLSPSGNCRYPSPTPIPGRTTDTDNQFTPSYPTKKPYRPSASSSTGYYYETPTPTFGYPSSTLIPNPNNDDHIYVPAPTTPSYLPPPDTTGSSIQDLTLPPREKPDNTGEQDVVNINRIPGPTKAPPPRVTPPRRPPPPPQDQNNEPPVGCAAALKCVQEIYCTAEGVVSPVPVVLTKDQELLRVPTTECRDEDTGIIGKCCRDPNYKDPWPSANLVNGVDDGQYKEDNLYGQHQGVLATNRLVRSSNGTRTNVRGSIVRSQNSQETCGERHQNSKPPGPGPLDANFAEYPWQAMILRDSNRSLLCGGAIIRRNAVLTAAHCVEGLDTSDVLIKGGEWKLGIDEEPLPFQIVKVGAILRHPEYVPGSYKNDLAILVLREKLRPSKNVGTICLPESNKAPTTNCIATGWGKRILQLHAKGAIMHHINVDVIDDQKCQQTLQQNFQSSVQNLGPTTICGVSEIDHCKVDYGSALACPNSQGQYTLTGIYAWDTGCKEQSQIGGYIAPDVEWIESTLAKSVKELKKIEREYLLKTSA